MTVKSLIVGKIYKVEKENYYVFKTLSLDKFSFNCAKKLRPGNHFLVLKRHLLKKDKIAEILCLEDGKIYFMLFQVKWGNFLSEELF